MIDNCYKYIQLLPKTIDGIIYIVQ